MSSLSVDYLVPRSGSSIKCGNLSVNGLPLSSAISTVTSLSVLGPWSTSPATHGVELISSGLQSIVKFTSVYGAAALSNLSSVMSFSATLPSGFIPTTAVAVPCYLVDGGANTTGIAQINTSGTLSISRTSAQAFATAGGNASIGSGTVLIYPIV